MQRTTSMINFLQYQIGLPRRGILFFEFAVPDYPGRFANSAGESGNIFMSSTAGYDGSTLGDGQACRSSVVQ